MTKGARNKDIFFLAVVGLAAWAIPGGGYFLLGQIRRALVVSVTILLTFGAGLYIGSIGVIDSVGAKPWYIAQVMNTPAVLLLGNHVAQIRNARRTVEDARQEAINARQEAEHVQQRAEDALKRAEDVLKKAEDVEFYSVFGRANEMGQIYTSIAGLLNLLCIVNAVYLAHLGRHAQEAAD
jgi:hypothetical protein